MKIRTLFLFLVTCVQAEVLIYPSWVNAFDDELTKLLAERAIANFKLGQFLKVSTTVRILKWSQRDYFQRPAG